MAGKPMARFRNGGSTKRAAFNTRKNGAELSRVGTIDDLALYDDLFNGALKGLKEDIARGMDAISLAKKYAALAQARIVTTALTEQDSGKALVASQDIVNRAHGRPIERKELRHALAESSDSELDAIINSKMAQLGSLDEGSESSVDEQEQEEET